MLSVTPESADERRAFHARIARHCVTPLWEASAAPASPHPAPACVPALWRYGELHPFLIEAGHLIDAHDVQRRVLLLENPGLRGASSITHSLCAGLQVVLPGESVHGQRHAQSALRLVIEGTGAYATIDAERTPLLPGDLVIAPSWTLEDHGNAGGGPVVWLDGRDMPMIAFDTGFAELPEGSPPIPRGAGDALARYHTDLLPLDPERQSAPPSILHYPYVRTRAALERMRGDRRPHASHGFKMQYVHPAAGGEPTPTIGAFIQLLPAGFRGRRYRATEGTVYCIVEGRGISRVGDAAFAWEPHDVFVVPSWCFVSHDADEDAVLLSYSDRPAQTALGLWREETLA